MLQKHVSNGPQQSHLSQIRHLDLKLLPASFRCTHTHTQTQINYLSNCFRATIEVLVVQRRHKQSALQCKCPLVTTDTVKISESKNKYCNICGLLRNSQEVLQLHVKFPSFIPQLKSLGALYMHSKIDQDEQLTIQLSFLHKLDA